MGILEAVIGAAATLGAVWLTVYLTRKEKERQPPPTQQQDGTLHPPPPPLVESNSVPEPHVLLSTSEPDPVPEPDDPITLYKQWALDKYSNLRLIGFDAGDVHLPLDDVYVPLRLGHSLRGAEGKLSEGEAPEELATPFREGSLELEEMFSPELPGGRHRALFGAPGSGKTTALLKLLHTCLTGGAERLGLPPETIPVFLRLRRTGHEELGATLETPIRHGLREESGGELPEELTAALMEHGKLLLLLDGLDEVPDDRLRAEICQFLEWKIPDSGGNIRAVVSCRNTGFGGVTLPEDFVPLEVRPLEPRQSEALVRNWFRAVEKTLTDEQAREARKQESELVATLQSDSPLSERRTLISSPFLLTLLCVVVYRGHEIPRERVEFFEQCLRVLLSGWSRSTRDKEPALEVKTSLVLLRTLAYQLHSEGRKYDLTALDFVEIMEDLALEADPFAILTWLTQEAAVLRVYAPYEYGFTHLALQEYLAARHIASRGEDLLDKLVERLAEQVAGPSGKATKESGNWKEVTLLLVGLPGVQIFGPLFGRLLSTDFLLEQADFLRACLEEAAEVDLAPFLEILETDNAQRQAAVLRLLRGRRDERFLAQAQRLATSDQPSVKALAQQIVHEATHPSAAGKPDYDLALLYAAADEAAALDLAQDLERRQITVLRVGEMVLPELRNILDHSRATAVFWRSGGEALWNQTEVVRVLELLAKRKRPRLAIAGPGEGELPALPPLFSHRQWLDYRAGVNVDALDNYLTAEAPEAAAAVATQKREDVREDPETGVRLRWVPEGRFQMGGTAYPDEQPVHTVRLSGFWLGETPVTNEQYGKYLAAVQAEGATVEEPSQWRDRRFSAPNQPVVGVSWEDASAFCRWLSSRLEMTVDLPTEAQWEYAARGEESREYPWGNQPPSQELACYEAEQPAPVGSYPAGRGPFKHLDLAGNVWEWCLDDWDEDAYKGRGEDVLDPKVTNSSGTKVLRGGSWGHSALNLRASYRSGGRAGIRNDNVGFRVAASASP